MSFCIPNDGELFIDQVLDRCRNLISSGIWEGITQVRLDTWMMNFASRTDRYFGACILDSLIYRSEKQTFSLMEHLFQRTLPDLHRQFPPTSAVHTSWLEQLRRSTLGPDPLLRIVPVIKWDDPPAKSGPALARLYRRHLNIGQHWMIWPWQIKRAREVGIRSFLFIDDFLGTGQQFCEFAGQFALHQQLRGCYSVYAPLVAHEDGVKKLIGSIPDLHVVAVERIDDSYNIFSKRSHCFEDGINKPESARDYYDRLAASANFPVKPEALRGYGKLALTYAFHHATPDNCLPIIWAEGPNWKPLLER